MEKMNEIPKSETIKGIMSNYKITGFALGEDKFTEIMDKIEKRDAEPNKPLSFVFGGIKVVKSNLLPPDAMVPIFENSVEFNVEDFDFTEKWNLRYKLQIPIEIYKKTNSNFVGDISAT